MTVELPAWPLVDRLSLLLALLAGAVLEAVLARYQGAPVGLGVASAGALVLGLGWQRRRRPVALDLGLAGGRCRFGDGRVAPLVAGPSARVLPPSVVVQWHIPGASGALWLTPADLPADALHAIAVLLATSASDSPAGRAVPGR